MGDLELLYRIALALAIGLMVGVERGWHARERASGDRVAGIRTFALVGLFGGIAAVLSDNFSEAVLVVAFLGVLALTVVGYLTEMRRADADRGLTTEVALLLTFALGAYAAVGDMALAGGATVVTVALLRLKPELHRLVGTIERFELNGAIRLLVISVVILPILPNRGFGPGEVINPYALWWMVVLIAALSFVGYFAIKLAGPRRGPILAGIFGGLASSTAATLGFSRMARRDPSLVEPMATGIGLACTIMFARILIVAGIVDRELAWGLVVPLGVMAAILLSATLILARAAKASTNPLAIEIADPADIPAALKFGVFLLALAILSHYLRTYFGASGMYALALVAGLADVDALTLTLAQSLGQVGDGSERAAVALAIVLGAISNTAAKAIMASWIGGRALAVRAALPLGAAAIAGLAVVALR